MQAVIWNDKDLKIIKLFDWGFSLLNSENWNTILNIFQNNYLWSKYQLLRDSSENFYVL